MGNNMSGEPDDDQSRDVIIDFSPVCRYGTACYRKNPEHFGKFRHPHLPTDPEIESSKETVEIRIEIGHDATIKTTPTPQGHTHDWTAFVRCSNPSVTGIFLEKVEFSFPQNVGRSPLVVDQPPFNVSDTGSRSFVMNIDFYFKNSPDPMKTRIDYDLYLKDNASFSNVRQVNLVFQNPPSAFRQRVLLAGGVMIQVPDSSTWDNVRQQMPSTSSSSKRKVDQVSSQSTNDECDAFGHLCTTKLRKLEVLSPPQKTLAEKLISEVLFYAERKSLTDDSCVHLTRNSLPLTTVNTLFPPLPTEPPKIASSSSAVSHRTTDHEVDSPSSPMSLPAIKQEVDSPSSPMSLPAMKQEVDSPPSPLSLPAMKQEVDSPPSPLSLPAIKSELDSPPSPMSLPAIFPEVPSSSSNIEECVILHTIKPKSHESPPFVIEIKEESD